jgi:hypothetical protein
MAVFTKAIGKTTKWTEKEFLHLPQTIKGAENMKGSTRMTEKMDRGC